MLQVNSLMLLIHNVKSMTPFNISELYFMLLRMKSGMEGLNVTNWDDVRRETVGNVFGPPAEHTFSPRRHGNSSRPSLVLQELVYPQTSCNHQRSASSFSPFKIAEPLLVWKASDKSSTHIGFKFCYDIRNKLKQKHKANIFVLKTFFFYLFGFITSLSLSPPAGKA